MTDRWTPAQLAGTIRWVLSIEYAGGTWYMCDVAQSIDDGAGGTIVMSDGLLEVGGTVEAIDLWASDAPRRSCQVGFDLGIDVAALIEEGHDLAGCVAELAQLADGDAWSERRPFVRGRLVEPQYGAQEEGLTASIEQDVLTDESQLRTVEVTPNEFGAAVAASLGWTYADNPNDSPNARVVIPIVIGTPGNGTSPGTKAIRMRLFEDTATLDRYYAWLIAGHAVEATTVTLMAEDTTTASFTVREVTLPTGEVISYVLDNIYAAVPAWTNTTETAVVFWDGGGGLIDQNYGPLRYAGDYVAWLLSLTEQDVDHARVNLAREQLKAFTVSTYMDESITISEYIREAVLDILPISMMVGPRGVYPLVWRWAATDQDAVAELDLTSDVDIARETAVTYEDADKIANTVQLLYGWAPRAETYTGEMWAVGDPASRPRGIRFGGGPSLSLSYWSDPVLARSVARYGVRRDSIESAIVADSLTAEHVLAWRSRRWALPTRVVEYSAPQSWGWIEPGDLVVVTDPDLAWSKRLCLVQSREWAADGSVRYALRVQES